MFSFRLCCATISIGFCTHSCIGRGFHLHAATPVLWGACPSPERLPGSTVPRLRLLDIRMHSGALSTIACHCASAHSTLSILAMTTALIDFMLNLNWAGSLNELLLFSDKLKLQGVNSRTSLELIEV